MGENKVVLSLIVDGTEAAVTFNYSEVTIDELFVAFKGILISHTFTENQIKNYIEELNKEYNEN